jgi:hypothetical protein
LQSRLIMKINKYFPFAFIYFFINSLGLPFGLTYTTILSPFFYWWVTTTRKVETLLPFFSIIIAFGIIHFNIGVDLSSYLVSLFNLAAVYIFCQAAYTFFKQTRNLEKIFWKLFVINFLLCLIAIPIYFTSFNYILWIQQYLTEGFDNFLRLKLFTYEASYYATLFTPLFFFYILKLTLKQNEQSVLTLLPMLFLPYLLSFSIGVISAVVVAIAITYFIYFKKLTARKRVLNIISFCAVAGFFLVAILVIFFPGNPLFIRIENIFSGTDSSGRGRTFEAFILADKMLAEKSYVWGIGLGQVKIVGAEIIRDYYLYPMEYNVFSIPNAAAETLAIFGWFGFTLRIVIEIILFFHTKVWKNYYRLLLFLFVFLYQFTGSFITNIAEYVIWILAFTNVFPKFNVIERGKIDKNETSGSV